jgi:hypothetical protein
VFLLAAGLAPLASCAKQVKAEFPRPPATASVPPIVETPEEVTPQPEVGEVPPPPPLESPVETEEAEAPPKARPRPRATVPPPEEEPAEAEPPSTTLAGADEVDPALRSKLERASTLLLSVSRRSLTAVQADQLLAARGFVAQARQALAEGDPRRALVLIDKGLILAEDVDRLSRP